MPENTFGCEAVDLTVLLPAYNEGAAIIRLVAEIRAALAEWDGTWELLVVDDASTDNTADLAELEDCRVLRRTENGGAGSARVSGIQVSRGKLIAMLDSDGSYDPACLPILLSYFPEYDQVNGARTSEQGTYRVLRTPAKWLLRKLAEVVSGKRIPDLNTGLKVFKRDVMMPYLWVVPSGFSCVTSMTLAFLCNGHPVKYVPVTYRKRIGRSKFHPVFDSIRYLSTIVRIIVYFRPLRVFSAVGGALVLAAVVKALYDVWHSPLGVHDSEVILFVSGVMTVLMGMLADLIVAQRRAVHTVERMLADRDPGMPVVPDHHANARLERP